MAILTRCGVPGYLPGARHEGAGRRSDNGLAILTHPPYELGAHAIRHRNPETSLLRLIFIESIHE